MVLQIQNFTFFLLRKFNFLGFIFLSACVSFEPSFNLPSQKIPKLPPLGKDVVLLNVSISDDYLKSNPFAKRQMTIQIANWLEKSGSFEKVRYLNVLPSEDVGLGFHIAKWEEKNEVDYLFLPLSFLSIGLYPIMGGTSSTEHFHIIGSWTYPGEGEKLHKINFNEYCSYPLNIYSPERIPRKIGSRNIGDAGAYCRSKVFTGIIKNLKKGNFQFQ